MPGRPQTSVAWDGLDDYLAALKVLPETCHEEAAHLIEGEVNAAYVTISGVYGKHRFTGTLQDRLVIVQRRVGTLVGGLTLKSGSPIAWLFDNGSQARHFTTASGAEHQTGKMWGRTPPTHVFARTVGIARRRLALQFRILLERHGAASVTDDGQ